PAAPKRTWTHWVLYDLPATSTGLTEGVGGSALPAGTREGKNDWGRSGFGGACPPIGRHRYFHKLYALDVVLGDLHAPDRQAVDKAMKGHVIAQVQLIATYAKHPGG
ncbi:MAG TPA: YbhB/YbcL family Raf kinase inhibitor-like protein, partial [Xanthomonadaceae bacterium]|nr:YbhB/YbcL family Raf kinase inhibitor-like protein [Xanthomonadaceae bacterium]